ncbi:MAG: hypothetical protein C4321_04390, partial [Chloroflexota bacterium]
MHLTDGDRVVSGQRVRYNWRTGGGEAFGAAADFRVTEGPGRLYVKGRRLVILPGPTRARPRRIDVFDATATTCPEEHPEYRITARRITLLPGRSLTTRGAAVWLGRTRLISLPRFRRSLVPNSDEERESFIPRLAYNQRYGLVLALRTGLDLGAETSGRIRFFLTTGNGITGDTRLNRTLGTPIYFTVSLREDATNQRARFLRL